MAVTRGVESMDESEVKDLLKTNKVGLLCLEDGEKPYAVPLEHHFNGKSLYFATSLRQGQRKMNCIKNNSNACYTIYDSRRENQELVSKGIRCRSVIVEGQISLAGVKELEDKKNWKLEMSQRNMPLA